LKVTVPAAAAGTSLAVNTTACPNADGFTEAPSVVVVGCSTICMMLALLGLKLLSPLCCEVYQGL